LLIAIGLRAFRSGFIHDQESGKRPTDSQAEPKRQLLVVAIATSVDSLFLGAVLNLRQTGLIDASIIFGAVAWLAAWSGHCVGKQLKDSSQLSGEITSGILLIVLGLASLKA
ncbi:unnamed protein product, partial [Hapterophycus canaliculatus]